MSWLASPATAQAPEIERDWPSDWSDLSTRTYYGSEREEKLRINALLLEEENWADHYAFHAFLLFGYTDYPAFTRLRLFPFYYRLKSKRDPRNASGVFPLYYAWGDGRERGLLTPLFFYGEDDAYDLSTLLLPIGYWQHSWSGGEDVWIFPGLYHRDMDGTSQTLLGPVYWRRTLDPPTLAEPRDRRRFTLFPLLDVESSGPRQGAILNDATTHAAAEGERSDGSAFSLGLPAIVPLLFRYDTLGGDDGDRFTQSHLLPLYLYSSGPGDSALLSPLFYYSSDDAHNSRLWLAPILPLLARYSDSRETRQQILNVWYTTERDESSEDGNDASRLASFWFAPVFFYYPDDWIFLAPFYYENFDDVDTDRASIGLLHYYAREYFPEETPYAARNADERARELSFYTPLFFRNVSVRPQRRATSLFAWLSYTSFEDTPRLRETRYANPLFFYNDFVRLADSTPLPASGANNAGADEDASRLQIADYSTTFFAPIVPLYYSRESSDYNARWLTPLWLDWRRDAGLAEWRWNRIWLAPLYFQKRDDYLYVLPLYFQPDYEDDAALSFSPLHYYSRESEASTLIAGPYYRRRDPEERIERDYILPLAWYWRTPRSAGDLLLPLYYNYEDRTRTIHINASGLHFSRERGPLFAEVAGGAPGEYYFDFDAAFLWNLFRVSTRRTFAVTSAETDAKPNGSNSNAAPDAQENERLFREPDFERVAEEAPARAGRDARFDSDANADPADPALSRKDPEGREDSRQYFGWTALYGLSAYEAADDARHFRLLPLSWFSWNRRNDDRVYVLPAGFLSYQREDLEYFALFPAFVPLYGRQRQGESFVESYLALGYLREYDAERERREHSVLWPLFNYYDSPTASGHRLLPLYWSGARTALHPEGEASWFVSPLYFQRGGPEFSWRMLPPLFYSESRRSASADAVNPGAGATASRAGAVYTPLFVYDSAATPGEQEMTTEWSLLSWLVYAGAERSDSGATSREASEFYSWLGGYSSARESEASAGSRVEREQFSVWFPIFYRTRDLRRSPGESEAKLDYDRSYTNLGLLLDREASEESGARGFSRYRLLPAAGLRTGDDPWFYLFPAYYEPAESPAEATLFALVPVLWINTDARSSRWFAAGLYGERESNYAYDNLLFLLERESGGDADSTALHAALRTLSYESDNSGSEAALLWRLAGGYASSKDEFDYNLTWHFHISDAKGWTNSFLPAWHLSYKYPAGTDPSGESAPSGETTWFLAGFYGERASDYAYDNLLFLLERESIQNEDKDDNDSLALHAALRSLSFESGADSHSADLLWGLGGGYASYPDSFEYNLLWHLHESRPDALHNSFVPLWYYDRDSYSTDWFFGPTLAWSSQSDSADSLYVGAGLLYYHAREAHRNDGAMRVLLGAIYQDVRRPSRGYRSRGSLWGLLWSYEQESETGFQRFSVLEFVYSRTRYEGDTSHRILGVRI